MGQDGDSPLEAHQEEIASQEHKKGNENLLATGFGRALDPGRAEARGFADDWHRPESQIPAHVPQTDAKGAASFEKQTRPPPQKQELPDEESQRSQRLARDCSHA